METTPAAAGFTAGATPAGEVRVGADMAALVPLLRQALPDVRALFLVGGYGRGEGGIVEGPSGAAPFNDYDLLAVLDRLPRRRKARLQRRLRAISPVLEEAVGVPVDVGLQDRRGLLRAPASILWHEMAEGHRLLWGATDVAFPRFAGSRLPLDEAILLLTNRASALLLRDVQRRGADRREVTPAEVVDALKVVLAWGDALLLHAGAYTCSYAARPARLRDLAEDAGPFPAELVRLYDRAIEFKLHPDLDALEPSAGAPLVERVRALHPRFLSWFEQRRLKRRFPSWRAYADPATRKLTSGPGGVRELAKHTLRLGPPRDAANLRLHARGTYDRLISVLPLLLVSPDPTDWDLAARLLNARPASGPLRWLDPARRYLALWK